ncbi:hypothetical protein I316_01326 [Kwoniella heveanensis BCC8398]|uniref:Uncharacterized protein n=1 Tax=Kwoniella heveanensis BCC8398 TaxID=1296120 RepID=A0A1B9H0E5_9TREE|nr:hypothetical protein I316_01326 [Kwoniella heveanensis BCC8398]
MPSLETAGTFTTMSTSVGGTDGDMTGTSTAFNTDSTVALSSGATKTGTSSGGASNATSTAYVYSYATSKIVRTAVAAGVIVLALTALVLFFKISSWIRYHQHLRRQRYLSLSLQSEQRANEYEIAAWADRPGTAPIHPSDRDRDRSNRRGEGKKRRKEIKEEIKAIKRGGANAWAVKEWEGVAS